MRSLSNARHLLPLALVLVGAGCAATATDDPSAVAPTGGGASTKGSADDSETKVATSTKPVKKGTLPFKGKDGTIRDRKVTIRGGRAYIGDMDFGPADDMTPRSINVSDLDLRWPNATVPYCFYNGSDAAIRLPQHTRDAFRTAAQLIQSHVPSIRFVERASCSEAVNDYASEGYLPPTPGDAVLVVMRQEDSGGHAQIGYANTARRMTLADDIGSFDEETQAPKAVHVVSHELGHVLGLKHEHQRPDRNEWVNICEINIPEDDEGDYEVLDPDDTEMLAPYQYHSKMHYPAKDYYKGTHTAFGCGGYAMEPLHETVPEVPGAHTVMGSRWFTSHDMNSLMLMYGPGLGAAEIDDKFGTAIAVGDFDLDGRDDVIVGGPGEKVGSGARSGTVYAYKGTWRSPAPWKLLRESAIAAEEDDDRFGTSFAVGDFVRQASCVPSTPGSCELPFPDLAVGVPGKRGDTKAQLGAVMMYMGGRFEGAVYRPDCASDPECRGTIKEPLAPLPVVLRAANARGVVGESGDLFGQSLAAGDFDGDGEMDLAVGAPGRGNGRVFIYRGADLKNGVYVSRELNPFGAANVDNAKFGWSLAAGDFDLDGKDDLAIGAPGAGAGQVVYFRGLTPTTNQVAVPILAAAGSLIMPSPTANTPTVSAQFGYSLAASHLLNTGRASLVVGAPAQKGVSTLSGAVHLYTWGPIPTAGPPMDGLAYRQTILSDGGRGERFGHSVALYSPSGGTYNDLAVGAPGRDSGKGGVTLYRPTSATNLAFRATVTASGTDSAYGSALVGGSVRMAPPPPPGLPKLPDATLLVGAPLALTSAIPAGRVAGVGFLNDNAALPTQMISFSQTMKTPYTR